jgi:SAM-dependent methyltransferase
VATSTAPGLQPVSRIFGFDRGQPVDRVYIERFLERHRELIRGRVLEVGDDTYIRKFGGSAVSRSEVLEVQSGNPTATYVDDFTTGQTLPTGAFDCVIVTQTLQLIFDLQAAIRTLGRIVAPGGAVLATVPFITQIQDEQWRPSWCWSMSTSAARRLFAGAFEEQLIEVSAYGNLTTAMAFLIGLAADEVPAPAFVRDDGDFPLIVGVCARKRSS